MLRSLYHLLAVLLLILPAAADELTVAVGADNPPFVFNNSSGHLSGFDIDMVNALCDAMQVNCRLQALPKDKLPAALNDSDIHAVLGIVESDVSDETIFLSQRYYKNGARFVGKKGVQGKIAYKRMAGKNVAVVQDTVFDIFLSEKFSGVNVRRYPDINAAYTALAADEVDYVLADRIKQYLLTAQKEDYTATGPNYSTAKYFSNVVIAVRDEKLQQMFNTALKALRNNGTYKTISAEYFPFDIYGR